MQNFRFLQCCPHCHTGLARWRNFHFFRKWAVFNRGGVEDTRLEAKAKAKDTKKIRGQGQGQGQPFRGQTLSRPRTGMLEAKVKDQGHKAQVLSKKKKKKGLHKNFSGDLQKKKRVFTKIFQAISKKKKKGSSQKFFKRSPQKNPFQKIFQPLLSKK